MILDSPQFLGLKIYVGEHPTPGSFYCPKHGDTLSHIANWAYGVGTLSYVLKINKSAWNIENCIYRRKSTKCTSTTVYAQSAAGQNNWSDGAWLALCPGDRQPWSQSLGLNYPVIWVPGLGGEEPGDLADAPIVGSPGFTVQPPTNGGSPAVLTPPSNGGGAAVFVPPSPVIGPIDTGGSRVPGNGKSKWPWILGIVLVAGVGGTAYYFYRQGKVSPRRVYA